ncbi:tyrosine-type recombinase/integrase [Weissella kandleri]|uniref:tyrosine-type recombinase/integrase n=1 Tax=Weissella kandleri TaxID=1616 RepID=UPI0007097993|nr:tyrosine-type recombinase/integrase [Weissella kandleri]
MPRYLNIVLFLVKPKSLRAFKISRYTHATLLISDGMEIKKVANRLGHKDISVTANIYAEVTPKAKKEVAERFSKILVS